MTCGEFFLISHYFNRVRTSRFDVEIGIGDDCALLNVPDRHTLAVSTDTLVCGRHFLPDIDPSDLAFKALSVSISDLAAMGADPAWLTLAITLPEINELWIKKFSDALFEQLNYYDIQLVGGDTTAGPLSMTLAIYGFVPIGHSMKRSGAKIGDSIYVTGTLGDSAVGLAILQNRLIINHHYDATYFIKRHLRPIPRILQGKVLRDCASTAIDISDGFISDLGHILQASEVGACIDLDTFPLSVPMCRHVNYEQALHFALSGGEDYELCFTVPEINRKKLNLILDPLGVPFTCIGKILSKKEGKRLIRKGKVITFNGKGYEHFK